MTYIDDIINKNPIKYDSLITNNISNKELKMKIDEYNNIQEEYASLLSKQSVNQGGWNDLQNTNYSSGLITQPKSENDMWKYLGQSDTLEECKLQKIRYGLGADPDIISNLVNKKMITERQIHILSIMKLDLEKFQHRRSNTNVNF